MRTRGGQSDVCRCGLDGRLGEKGSMVSTSLVTEVKVRAAEKSRWAEVNPAKQDESPGSKCRTGEAEEGEWGAMAPKSGTLYLRVGDEGTVVTVR